MRAWCLGVVFAASLIAADFEVASIRENSAGVADAGVRDRIEVSGATMTARNASLSYLIQWAFDLKFYQIAGPDWVKERRFDIQAKAPQPVPESEFRQMLQGLLRNRFQLVTHSERREQPVYALLTGKNAPRREQAKPAVPRLSVVDGSFVFSNVSTAALAEYLSDLASIDRPVIDRTGLTGSYDVRLEGAAQAIRTGNGPAIFTSVEEAGFQLRPVREALPVLVIDSCAREPSAN